MSATSAAIRACCLVLAFALGCDGAQLPAETREPEGAPATASSEDASPDAPFELPPAGQLRFRVDGDDLTLLANQTPRLALLELLAERLDFELVPGDVGIEPVSLQLERGQLRDALPALLPDRAYRVQYRVDKDAGRHHIARLEIAPSSASAFVPAPDDPVPPYVPELAVPPPRDTPAPRAEVEVDWRALVERLDDANAEERIEALALIDPDGEGLSLIIDRLARDPEPTVRMAAAEKLEFADTLAGVDALVRALSDPDKRVVLAAIDALELTDDHTVTEDLAKLLDHPDEEIREAARDARDFISDEGEFFE